MNNLSVVLATYNEEKNLPACLDSIKGLADEIIVVDGGSKDKTAEIAKKYGARMIITDNPPIFHINKQKATDLAAKDWVLQLDADERVTPELKNEIEQVLQRRHSGLSRIDSGVASAPQNDENINGYWFPRKNWFLGRFLMKGGQYPDYTLRLYHRGKGKLPCKSVHEQAAVDGKVGYLQNPLIHLADTNFQHYLLRWNRYTDLMAAEIKEQVGQKNRLWKVSAGMNYLLIKPAWWFLTTYIRHKGFVDSWQGLVFSFFSSLRFPVAYLKYKRGQIRRIICLIGLICLMGLIGTGQVLAGGYVLPYPSLMPGNRLYKVKLTIDKLQELWAFGSFAKFSFYLHQADQFLVEAKTLFEYKQYFLAMTALKKSDKNFETALIFLKKAEKEGKKTGEKVQVFQEAALKHQEVLEKLLKETPVEFNWQPEKKEANLLKIKEKLEVSLEIRKK